MKFVIHPGAIKFIRELSHEILIYTSSYLDSVSHIIEALQVESGGVIMQTLHCIHCCCKHGCHVKDLSMLSCS